MTWDTFLTLMGSKPSIWTMYAHSGLLKVMGGWGGGVVAHEILVSAQGPLVLVLGLRVWGQGLTIVVGRKDK